MSQRLCMSANRVSNDTRKMRLPPWLLTPMVGLSLRHLACLIPHCNFPPCLHSFLHNCCPVQSCHQAVIAFPHVMTALGDWHTIWFQSGEEYANDIKAMLSQLPAAPRPTQQVTWNLYMSNRAPSQPDMWLCRNNTYAQPYTINLCIHNPNRIMNTMWVVI